jgi:hypothetical protein
VVVIDKEDITHVRKYHTTDAYGVVELTSMLFRVWTDTTVFPDVMVKATAWTLLPKIDLPSRSP